MKTAGWAGLCRDHPELVGALIAHATGATADEDQQPKATTSKQLSTGTGNFFARVFRKK
jgi:hypothetical protein